jgi:adenylate kinase family enzyme
MLRIAIIGSSGAGKTTLARALAARLGIPAVELDAINWQVGWRDLVTHDPEAFAQDVQAAVAGEAWVIDGNYGLTMPRVLRRATDLVWLDYSLRMIMNRVIRRSVARAISRRELWPGTGNRETWRRWLDKDHPIRWAWSTFAARRARYETLFADPRLSRLRLHRLRHPREARALAADLERKRGVISGEA